MIMRLEIKYLYRSFQNYSTLFANCLIFVEKLLSVSGMAMMEAEPLLEIVRKIGQHIYKKNYWAKRCTNMDWGVFLIPREISFPELLH